jgi:poly-gamma-glutamate capsule biosynthesis protein CapA/YwtB (metallophosphatase superfamily)
VGDNTTNIAKQLGGTDSSTTQSDDLPNNAAGIDSAGGTGPVEYIKPETLTAIKNPFYADEGVMYVSEANGVHFAVYALQNETSGAADAYLVRTDKVSAAYDADAAPTSADLSD